MLEREVQKLPVCVMTFSQARRPDPEQGTPERFVHKFNPKQKETDFCLSCTFGQVIRAVEILFLVRPSVISELGTKALANSAPSVGRYEYLHLISWIGGQVLSERVTKEQQASTQTLCMFCFALFV